MAVPWLRFHTSNARGAGLILVWGTKIPHALKPNKQFCFVFVFVCLFVCLFSRKSLKKKSQGVDAIGLALINHKHLETSKNKTREPIEE